MALGAMAKYPGLDVKIVPCGKVKKRVFFMKQMSTNTLFH